MRGRKPDPGAPRRGTARDRKHTDIVPVEYSGAITLNQTLSIPLPKNLPRSKAAKELWFTLLQEVARHELRAGDLPIVEAACVAKWRHLQAGEFVKKFGLMIKGPYGPARNPMLKEERDQAMLYDRLAQRLGLSPESRIRLDLMQIVGSTLLGSLKLSLDEIVEADMADVEIIDGEVVIDD